MKNRKIIIGILLIVMAVILIVLGTSGIGVIKTPPVISDEPPKVAEKRVVDGHMTNVEETIRAQVLYENYRFKALGISEQGPYYVVSFLVDNITDQQLEHKHLSFTFLDSNKRVITEVNLQIPELNANETKVVQIPGVSKKAYDAFYYKVSKPKEIKLPDKNS